MIGKFRYGHGPDVLPQDFTRMGWVVDSHGCYPRIPNGFAVFPRISRA